MQNSNLTQYAIDKIEDMKARDIVCLDVSEQSTVTDTMIICSGNSNRHVKSIAYNLVQSAKHDDIQVLSIEGVDESEWVLVDLGSAIVHVMLDSAREYYELEKLWNEAKQIEL